MLGVVVAADFDVEAEIEDFVLVADVAAAFEVEVEGNALVAAAVDAAVLVAVFQVLLCAQVNSVVVFQGQGLGQAADGAPMGSWDLFPQHAQRSFRLQFLFEGRGGFE